MAVNNPTATVTSVPASTSAVTLFAAQAGGVRSRKIYNDADADLYVKLGSSASTSDFTVMIPSGGYFEDESYDGIVTGVWSSATGAALCTEVA